MLKIKTAIDLLYIIEQLIEIIVHANKGAWDNGVKLMGMDEGANITSTKFFMLKNKYNKIKEEINNIERI